jgi:hypothetical protein
VEVGAGLKVNIKRTKTEAIVKVKTNVPDEKHFKFSLSPTISQQSLKLILPMLIKSERDNRIAKAIRSVKTKATRARNKARKELEENEDEQL